jgi:hypothetical protein
MPYPYAYLKGMTFGALVAVPLILFGLERLWATRFAIVGLSTRAWRVLSVGLACGMAALVLLNTIITTSSYADQTQTVFTGSVLPPSSLQLRDMLSRIPAGAPVFISTTPPMRPEVVSAAAFFLRSHPLIGNIQTLESKLDNQAPGGTVPDFGLLAATEDPTDRGYDPGDVVWSNADVKLYRRGKVVAHLLPAGPDPLTIAADRPLPLALASNAIYPDAQQVPADPSSPALRQLVLQLGTLRPQTVHLSIDGQVHDLSLAGGLSTYSTALFTAPAQVLLSTDSASPVFVRSLGLRDEPDAVSKLTAQPDVLVVAPTVAVHGDDVMLRLPYAGADLWTPQMAIGLNVGGSTTPDGTWNEFAWWGTDLRRSEVDVDLNLASKQATASTPSEEDLQVNSQQGQTLDGTYTAALNFWEPTQASMGWHSPFYDLFTFEVQDGQIVAPHVLAQPVLFLPWRTAFDVSSDAMAQWLPQVAAIQAVLPPSAQVFLPPDLRQRPEAVAALIHGLPGAVFYAEYVAGAQYPEHGRVYDYAVLRVTTDPVSFGYTPQDRLLVTADLALYRRGSTLAHLGFADAGQYPRLTRGDELSLYVTPENLSLEVPEPNVSRGSERVVDLSLASLTPSAVTIQVGDGEARTISLPPGLVHYRSPVVGAPDAITIAGSADEPVFLVAADLRLPSVSSADVVSDPAMMVVSTQARAVGASRIELDVQRAGGGASADFYMGLNLNGFGVPDKQWFAGAWSGIAMSTSATHVELDLETLTASASNADGPVPVTNKVFELRDGSYTAELSFWEPRLAEAGWQTPFIRLFSMDFSLGQPTRIIPTGATITLVPLTNSGQN